MNYLLLVYEKRLALAGLSTSAQQRRAELGDLTDDLLRTSGRLLAGAQVPTTMAVTTVALQETQFTVMDGALTGGTWQLSAFYYITARDLNDAIQVAAHMPQLHNGAIEVHPLSG